MSGPPRIFDHALLDRRRRRALRAATPGAGFLLDAAAGDLADRLTAVKRRFALAVEVGSLLPIVGERLMATGQIDRLIRTERLPEAGADVVADEELFPFAAESLDLVVSALALQFTNDLPGTLSQIRRALKPDGLLLAALVGGDTLTELRESLAAAEAELSGGASPRVAPFAEVRALGNLLQRAGFALPVTDQDRFTIRYADAFALMRDLRAMGATNVLVERSRKPLARAVLLRAAAIYGERFADADGRVRATFEVISLSGWAPHESQQKPLRPGSAKVRLADALGTVEHSAGEKAGR
jgi:SAM-dependent methyltransferase